MTNILVPTDFSLHSLEIVREIVRNQHQPVKIYLLHMVEMPTDIAELMFLKKTSIHKNVPVAFSQGLQELRTRFASKLASLELKLHYGSRSSVFNAIAENLGIDEICLLEDYSYKTPLKNSVDIMPMINRSDIPVYKVESRSKLKRVGEARVISSFGISEPYTSLT